MPLHLKHKCDDEKAAKEYKKQYLRQKLKNDYSIVYDNTY